MITPSDKRERVDYLLSKGWRPTSGRVTLRTPGSWRSPDESDHAHWTIAAAVRAAAAIDNEDIDARDVIHR